MSLTLLPGLSSFLLNRYRFWERGSKTATPTAQKHMVESLTAYLESVVQQAADRDSDKLRTIDEYLLNRRENIGARPSYVPMELDLNLVDEVFYHPVLVELSVYIADLIILDNVCVQTLNLILEWKWSLKHINRTLLLTTKSKQREMTDIIFLPLLCTSLILILRAR